MKAQTTKRSIQHIRTRQALLKQLACALALLRRELELIAQNPLQVYRRLRAVGRLWKKIKRLLTRLNINVDEWAHAHLSITRQWADKHAELDSRWREFLVAMDWAETMGWERDRQPSVKKAMEMMEARNRYRSIIAVTKVAVKPKSARTEETPSASQTKLDIARVDFRCGDALAVLRTLPDESVHTCLTSPPYWQLRDYCNENQIGLEPDPEQYIKKIVEVMRELARVLRPDGTAWLVLGDTYTSNGGTQKPDSLLLDQNAIRGTRQKTTVPPNYKRPRDHSLGAKNLMLMPARIALALMADVGRTLRSEIVWEKPSVRPESVADRPTRSHEFIFLFAKGKQYTYNADAIKEPRKRPPSYAGLITGQKVVDYLRRWGDPSGRNARTVWRIAVKPYHGDHPATFPVELAERCLRATLPPNGVAIDPFGGAGSTAIAALRLGASIVHLIDINRSYLTEARLRIADTAASPIPIPSGPMILSPTVTLYHGDCRDIMPGLPDGSFDIVVADSPYWMRIPERETLVDFHRRNNGRQPRIRLPWDQFYSVDDYLDFTEEWLRHSIRLLHEKGSLFVFASQHNLGLVNFTLQRLGIEFVNHIVWHKPNGEPNLSGRRLACRHEGIIWAVKERGYRFHYKDIQAQAYSDNTAGIQANDVWTMPHIGAKEAVGHPAQKPLAVYQRLFDMCGIRGVTLLDPFGGSGTAAIAGMRWGMRAVLIERDREYIDLIKRRVAANDNEKTGSKKSG